MEEVLLAAEVGRLEYRWPDQGPVLRSRNSLTFAPASIVLVGQLRRWPWHYSRDTQTEVAGDPVA